MSPTEPDARHYTSRQAYAAVKAELEATILAAVTQARIAAFNAKVAERIKTDAEK